MRVKRGQEPKLNEKKELIRKKKEKKNQREEENEKEKVRKICQWLGRVKLSMRYFQSKTS